MGTTMMKTTAVPTMTNQFDLFAHLIQISEDALDEAEANMREARKIIKGLGAKNQ